MTDQPVWRELKAGSAVRTEQTFRRTGHRVAVLITVVILTLLAVSGCTSPRHASSSSGAESSAAVADGPAQVADGDAAAGANAAAGGGATPEVAPSAAMGAPAKVPAKAGTPLQQEDFVRTAAVDVQVQDVDHAAGMILAAAARVTAQVSGDQRSSSGDERNATLVLRVPPARLDGLIAYAVTVGKELDRTVNGEDVTAAHADVNARVKELTISVGRLQNFLKDSGSIGDLVALESQLTQREAELASTVAQQRALENQIAIATLTIQLKGKAVAPIIAGHNPSGFATAIGNGWHGLTVGFRWIAAVLGYALPFLLLLALVLVPMVLVQRRRKMADRKTPSADLIAPTGPEVG
ncbi:DUF4349 domain-containing protein [Jatrophihabitans sp. DSM 45814]